ncbi:hypothetical protein CNR22_17830 [Sphingobacteriaceae bacterium]|nr:hypothetical protein CNR22_17830 [Sphingobacteriaceae bacterium]
MKPIYLLFVFSLFFTCSYSQQVMTIPVIRHKPLRVPDYNVSKLNEQINILNLRQDSIVFLQRDLTEGAGRKNRYNKLFKQTAEKIDKAIEENSEIDYPKLIASLNETPNFVIAGVGGISNISDAGTANGNFSAGLKIRLTKYKPSNYFPKLIDPHYVYLGFNTKTHFTEDSAVLAKSVLFPDISRRDFVFSYNFELLNPKNGVIIQPVFVEFGLNKYSYLKDSTENAFKSENFSLGFKISKSGLFKMGADSIKAGIQFFPYYSVINIQTKYQQPYYDALSKNSAITWHCLGVQALMQLSDVVLFCNMKYVLNKNNSERPQDLRGFTYTIGTMIGVDIFRF